MEIEVDATQASQEATSNATSAANQAEQAATAANAAAVNQGQLIEAVTAASREDAAKARSEAEQAADEAKSQAEAARDINEETKSIFGMLIGPIIQRIEALETKPSEPVMVQGDINAATPIDPSATEGAQQSENQSGGGEESGDSGEAAPSSPSKRRHGRRGR